MNLAFKDAVEITTGYTEQQCRGCKEGKVWVPPWFKPHAFYCDTCRAMVIDEQLGMNNNERDAEEEDNEC